MLKLSAILLKIGQFIKASRVETAMKAFMMSPYDKFTSTNILTNALNAPVGLTVLLTGASTTGLPVGDVNYSIALILRRVSDQCWVVVFGYKSTKIYINTYLGNAWIGWRVI